MAEEEELRRQGSPVGGDISPSPAPRPWLSRHESDKEGMRRIVQRSPVESKSKGGFLSRRSTGSSSKDDTRNSLGSSKSGDSLRSSSSLGELERKVKQAEDDRGIRDRLLGRQSQDTLVSQRSNSGASDGAPRIEEDGEDRKSLGSTPPSRQNSLFRKSRIGPKIAETGDSLAKKTSDGSLDGSPQKRRSWGTKGNVPRGWLKKFMSMPLPDRDRQQISIAESSQQLDEDVPIPSIETGPDGLEPTPPSSRPTSADAQDPSQNKSYAWQVDADFTAGDIQFSDSPRIRVNTKLDEIRALEIANGFAFGARNRAEIEDAGVEEEEDTEEEIPIPRSEPVQPRNTKLDEIRARELEAENMAFGVKKSFTDRQNTKLDEIRAREIETLSKKAIATSRLDEIRELNSLSAPAEVRRQASREFARETTPGFDPETKERLPGKTVLEEEGEQIPNTPITIFRKNGSEREPKGKKEHNERNGSEGSDKGSRSSSGSRPSHMRDESRELLRRLARVTSSSPAPEADKEAREDLDKKSTSSRQSSKTSLKNPMPEFREAPNPKLSVGFAGLRRERSVDSIKAKRSSMALSDNDPTDRIEGEMMLFAPAENHSERGSIRAPSPDQDSEREEDPNRVEETPRPLKKDPLTLPTPKVVGAYVETPATMKGEKREADAAPSETDTKVGDDTESGRGSPKPRGRKSSAASQSANTGDNNSDIQTHHRKDPVPSVSVSATSVRRRARSLPKRRPPLINTAKPPTVKDDLLDLHRAHQIDDSTLDDFGEMFSGQGQRATSPDIEALLNDIAGTTGQEEVKMEMDEHNGRRGDDGKSDREKELETYNRMNKTLKTGLFNIHSAKQGIERLEGKVANSEARDHQDKVEREHRHVEHSAHCPSCAGHATQSAVAYLHIPIPKLYSHTPSFHFTLLGLLLFTLSLWYAAESATCAVYCRPQTCSPGQPCIWSPADPTFGVAIPVKLDEFATHGLGRKAFNSLIQELDDWRVDVWDSVLGRDIAEIDITSLDFEGRRQHRRRLRKKGLSKERVEPEEHKAKWEAWRTARLARERAREAREMGFVVDGEEEGFGADERIW
jgi:hypothetical protein